MKQSEFDIIQEAASRLAALLENCKKEGGCAAAAPSARTGHLRKLMAAVESFGGPSMPVHVRVSGHGVRAIVDGEGSVVCQTDAEPMGQLIASALNQLPDLLRAAEQLEAMQQEWWAEADRRLQADDNMNPTPGRRALYAVRTIFDNASDSWHATPHQPWWDAEDEIWRSGPGVYMYPFPGFAGYTGSRQWAQAVRDSDNPIPEE